MYERQAAQIWSGVRPTDGWWRVLENLFLLFLQLFRAEQLPAVDTGLQQFSSSSLPHAPQPKSLSPLLLSHQPTFPCLTSTPTALFDLFCPPSLTLRPHLLQCIQPPTTSAGQVADLLLCLSEHRSIIGPCYSHYMNWITVDQRGGI